MGLFDKFKKNDNQKISQENFDRSGELTEDELEQVTSFKMEDYLKYLTEEEITSIMNSMKTSEAMETLNKMVTARKIDDIAINEHNQGRSR